MSINKQWHETNVIPKNPTIDQRIQWHTVHAKHCGCRPIPEKLMKIIEERKYKSAS